MTTGLPGVIPVFPLEGVILLPRARLPLQVFEPRYVAMTEDALGQGRWIGMIQPDPARGGEAVRRVGCVGRITAFSETDDGRFLIVLTGISRFTVTRELEGHRGYRRVEPDWEPFGADLMAPQPVPGPVAGLVKAVRVFAAARGIELELESLSALPEAVRVNALSVALPLSPEEKQALLEVATVGERAEMLAALIAMEVPGASGAGGAVH